MSTNPAPFDETVTMLEAYGPGMGISSERRAFLSNFGFDLVEDNSDGFSDEQIFTRAAGALRLNIVYSMVPAMDDDGPMTISYDVEGYERGALIHQRKLSWRVPFDDNYRPDIARAERCPETTG